MTKTLVEQYVEDPAHMRLFQQERAIYEVTELIESVMAQEKVSRSKLAERLGQSRSWVTQLLDGQKNKTIRTVADVFAVLGREYCSFQRPIQIGAITATPTARVESRALTPSDRATVFQMYDPNRRSPRKTTESSETTVEVQVGAVN
jgi:transcriptional regulator with XRE-family HTH domain